MIIIPCERECDNIAYPSHKRYTSERKGNMIEKVQKGINDIKRIFDVEAMKESNYSFLSGSVPKIIEDRSLHVLKVVKMNKQDSSFRREK